MPTLPGRLSFVCAFGLALSTSIVHGQGLTTIVSVDVHGHEGSNASQVRSISDDGRYVVYESWAPNLVPGDVEWGDHDLFVHDRQTATNTRVSVAPGGADADAPCTLPSISGDGSHVVFVSTATNLGGGTSGERHVYLYARVAATTVCLDCGSAIGPVNADWAPRLATDARFVVVKAAGLWLLDRTTTTWTRVDVSESGLEPNGGAFPSGLSSDGRYVAFTSGATNFGWGDTTPGIEVFLRDVQLGITTLVSRGMSGQALLGGVSSQAAISSDARWLAFRSLAGNDLPGGGAPGGSRIYLKDLANPSSILLATRTPTGGVPTNAVSFQGITPDGSKVAFTSDGGEFVPGDTNATYDAFVFDRDSQTVARVSLDTDSYPLDEPCQSVVLDASGRLAAFSVLRGNVLQALVHDRNVGITFAYCFGDLHCPCANSGGPDAGCENWFGTGGARLAPRGNASISDDTLALDVDGLPPAPATLFLQGRSLWAAPTAPFGDGLLCVGGPFVRLATRTASNGAVTYGTEPGDVPVSVRGGASAGARFGYQVWYRHAPAYCTSATFNLSNALEVHWAY